MKFGLALPQYDFSLPGLGPIDWGPIKDWAQKAENLGFDSVWLSDHLFLDLGRYGGTETPQNAMECFTTLAAVAASPRRVGIGSLVACNDLRHPAVLAKMAETINAISGERLVLGMGAGWYEAEYKAAGIAFERAGVRINKLADAIHTIKRMSPAVPIIVGGKGDRVVKLAARHADGFNTVWAWKPEDLRGRIELLNRTAAAAGRDPGNISKSVGLYCCLGLDESQLASRWKAYVEAGPLGPGSANAPAFEDWRQDKLAGLPDEIATRVSQFEELGVEEVILSFGLLPFQICDAGAVEDFMREVIPLVK